ncbi:MAG TPA: CHAT domain-containing protein, partial [Thermoanaerobaculia bacterium]|nr:CHAT domain-containing protein [Thermoanaerobaculia bacterium]
DQTLSEVPFAALYDTSHSRFLIEDTSLDIAPSATWHAVASARPRTTRSALVVADPAFDTTLFPDLPRLAGAALEGRAIAQQYQHSRLLSGDAATKAAVVRELAHFNTIHFATHAAVSAMEPWASALLLAPSGQDHGTLSIAEVIALDGRSALETVVLAGCRTAKRERGFGDVRSLAYGFLAAGARNAIGTLWELDDDVGMTMSRNLHTRLARGTAAADAVRDVQLLMLRTNSGKLSRPSHWAAIEVFGSGY